MSYISRQLNFKHVINEILSYSSKICLSPPNHPLKCVFFKPSVGYRRETSTVTLGKPVQRWFKCHVSFCKGRLTFEWPLMHSDLSVSWLSTVYKWVAVKHLAIFCKCTAAISKAWEFRFFFIPLTLTVTKMWKDFHIVQHKQTRQS